MKKKVATIYAICFTAIVSVVIAGCFLIKTVTQPTTIKSAQQFTTTLAVTADGANDATPHYGIVGVKVPNDWKIDSVWYSGGYNNACAYLPPTEKDKEPGGQVDYWTDSLESRFPSGADMKWIVYQSVTANAVLTTNQDVVVSLKMTPGATQGSFKIGYFVSDAALDFSDTAYYSASLNNPITISGVLPVELTSFSASSARDGVNLTWQTATENNNRGFEIERSIDNRSFISVGFVKGNGTTSEKSYYSFTDKPMNGQVYYYRLKQVDFDGTSAYSKIIEVKYSAIQSFKLQQNFPNPFNPTTNIKFDLPVESNVTLTVYNSLGEMVKVIAQGVYQSGSHDINFNAANLTSGIYYYTISAKGASGKEYTHTAKMLLLK